MGSWKPWQSWIIGSDYTVGDAELSTDRDEQAEYYHRRISLRELVHRFKWITMRLIAKLAHPLDRDLFTPARFKQHRLACLGYSQHLPCPCSRSVCRLTGSGARSWSARAALLGVLQGARRRFPECRRRGRPSRRRFLVMYTRSWL